MSRIPDLGPNFANLGSVLAEYELDQSVVEMQLSVDGKTAKQAQKDQVEYPYTYERKRVELKTIVDYLKLQLDKKRAELFQRSVENYSHELSDRARTIYVEGNSEYLLIKELLLEVEEVYQLYASIVDAWVSRGFALKDHTAIIVNGLQERVF